MIIIGYTKKLICIQLKKFNEVMQAGLQKHWSILLHKMI